MDFDVILKDIGEFGRYQQLLLVTVILPACLPGGFHGFSQIFSVATPKNFRCHLPNVSQYNLTSVDEARFLPSVNVDGKDVISHCDMYDVDYEGLFGSNAWTNFSASPKTEVTRCKHGWEYDKSTYQSTIVTEWNLVCDKDFYPTLSLEIHTVGTLIGSLFFGYLGDRVGRKKAFYAAALLQLLSGIATAVSPNFLTFCIVRFLNGLTIVPVWIFPLIMGLELIGPSKRAPVGVTMSVFYTLGVVGLAGIAYFIRSWVYLQLAVTLPFAFFIAYWWVLPESPRWLMSQGRFEEMVEIIKKIARVNGVSLTEEYLDRIHQNIKAAHEEEDGKRRYNIFDLFRTPNLRRKTFLVVFNSFSNYAVYNGLNFFVPHLGDEEHLSFLLTALVELPSYLILYLTLNRLGRRLILMSTMVAGGIFCIVASVVTNADSVFLIIVFLLSKFCITCSFFVTDLVASELFPTVVRGAGASLTQTVSAIGLCISPIITHFAKHYLFVPLIIFGILAIVGGAITLILPETANEMLPETIEEGEQFGKDMSWRDVIRLVPRKKKPTELRKRSSLSEARVLLNGDLVPLYGVMSDNVASS